MPRYRRCPSLQAPRPRGRPCTAPQRDRACRGVIEVEAESAAYLITPATAECQPVQLQLRRGWAPGARQRDLSKSLEDVVLSTVSAVIGACTSRSCGNGSGEPAAPEPTTEVQPAVSFETVGPAGCLVDWSSISPCHGFGEARGGLPRRGATRRGLATRRTGHRPAPTFRTGRARLALRSLRGSGSGPRDQAAQRPLPRAAVPDPETLEKALPAPEQR